MSIELVAIDDNIDSEFTIPSEYECVIYTVENYDDVVRSYQKI